MSWLSSLTGVHISPKGFSVEPTKLLTDAMALTGNPAAIAGVIGNGINAVSPNSTLGHIGSTVGSIAPMAAGATGGLGALSKLPGIGAAAGAISKIPGASTVESMLGKVPGLSQVGNAIESAVGGTGAAGGSGGGLLQSLEGFLTGNGGANALGIAQGVNAAQLQQKANNYAKDALGTVQQSYSDRAPLRTAGIQGMLHPQTPSLAPLASIASIGSPYAPKLAPVTPGAGQ